jgi:hypothetical protein
MDKIPQGALACFLDERDFSQIQAMLVGGYYLPKQLLQSLDSGIASIKQEYGLEPGDVVKWNFRDGSCKRARQVIGDRVDSFRDAVFSLCHDLDIRLLMSMVWKGDASYTPESWQWGFENILQRLCIVVDRKRRRGELAQGGEYPFLDVVFDWLPNQGKVDEYFRVFSGAYHNGYEFLTNKLPALRDCNACPCLLVTSVRHSPALQVADFLVGATGDFLTWAYQDEREQSVKRFFVPIYDLFHRDEKGTVLGKGLVVSKSTKPKLAGKIRELGLVP